jgi:hypothetical protein
VTELLQDSSIPNSCYFPHHRSGEFNHYFPLDNSRGTQVAASIEPSPHIVIPAKAGIQRETRGPLLGRKVLSSPGTKFQRMRGITRSSRSHPFLDSRLRGNESVGPECVKTRMNPPLRFQLKEQVT